MTYRGFRAFLSNYCTDAFGERPNNEEARQLAESVLQEVATKFVTIEMLHQILSDVREGLSEHVVVRRQSDRTGGLLTLKYHEGVYQLISENKTTGFYEQLFETKKTSLAHHNFYTVFMATADEEFKKDIAECDFSDVLSSELCPGVHV